MAGQPLILVVDDESDFREVLVAKLRAAGFTTVEAPDGEAAIEKAHETRPNLIIMDVKMPKMDGIAALLKMKDDPEIKDIRVILLTAFGDPQQEIFANDKRFAQEVGAYDYFLKTQDLNELIMKVREALAPGKS